MHYLIRTVGPVDRDYLTHVVLTFMNYVGYHPPGRVRAGASRAATHDHRVGMSQPLGRPSVQTLNPVRNVLAVKRSTALISQQRAQQERPASLQLGIELTIQPGITIQEINDLGRAEQDLFLWEAHQRPAMLTVTSQGAHYDWRNLPLGWNNPQWNFAPPVQIGQFRPGQPIAVRGSVAGMTTAQKVMEAMFRSLKADLPEGVAAIIKDMMQPENIAKIVLVQTLYAGSMFIGVGEVATLVMVAAGFYFVGQEVLAFIDGVKAFVETVTKAQTEEDLDKAAAVFAQLMISGVNIAQALFTRRGGTHQPNSVVRMRAHSAGGGGKKPAGGGGSGKPPSGGGGTPPGGGGGKPPGGTPPGKPGKPPGRPIKGLSDPRDILDEALKRQGKTSGDAYPAGYKEKWSEDGYDYEVRIHQPPASAPAGSNSASGPSYRVARRQHGFDANGQGHGWEYMDDKGTWHRQADLKAGKNPAASNDTHIPVPNGTIK